MEEEIFLQKYTCRNSIHTFPSVPDFMKPVREGGKKIRGEKGSGDTRDLISYSSVFASSVSGRFHRSELLICSLHSICSACHCYRIICRVLRPLEEVF